MNEWLASVPERIALVLLHSLWQGALVANATAVALAVTSRASSRVRYGIACGGLACLAIAPFATWMVVETSPTNVAVPAIDQSYGAPIASSAGTVLSPVLWLAWLDRACRAKAGWLAGAWLVGVVVLTLRLLVAWIGVQRLRRVAGSALPAELAAGFADLVVRMKATPAVTAIASTRIQVPCVIGWFRPIVLLPARAISGLDAETLERLIAHELAHVVRGDYAVNFLQRLVETVWFHHPAAWWLSHRIREEREFCCDELAVAATGDRHAYARALAELEELQGSDADLGLALGSNGGHLMRRVRRILGVSTPVEGGAGAVALAVLALVAALAWSTLSPQATAQQDKKALTKKADLDGVEEESVEPEGRTEKIEVDRSRDDTVPREINRIAPLEPDLATIELEAAEAKELFELSQQHLKNTQALFDAAEIAKDQLSEARDAALQAELRHVRAAALWEASREGKPVDDAKLSRDEVHILQSRLDVATSLAAWAEALLQQGQGTAAKALEAKREAVLVKYALERAVRKSNAKAAAVGDRGVDSSTTDRLVRVRYPLQNSQAKAAAEELSMWAGNESVAFERVIAIERTNTLEVIARQASQDRIGQWVAEHDNPPAGANADASAELIRYQRERDRQLEEIEARGAEQLRQKQAIDRELAQLDVDEAKLKVEAAKGDLNRASRAQDEPLVRSATAAVAQAEIGLRRAELKLKALDLGKPSGERLPGPKSY